MIARPGMPCAAAIAKDQSTYQVGLGHFRRARHGSRELSRNGDFRVWYGQKGVRGEFWEEFP